MWGGGGDAAEVVRAETERSVFVGPSAGDHCCCGAIRFGDILATRDKWRLPEIFVGKPACTVPGVSLKCVVGTILFVSIVFCKPRRVPALPPPSCVHENKLVHGV